MLTWILAAIVLYFAGLFIPATMVLLNEGPLFGAGPRDAPATQTRLIGRARRAHENFKETLVIFLALAILSLLPETGPEPLALTGAALFVLARIVYIPLYLSGVPFVRTIVWSVGLAGLICMMVAVF